MKPLIYVLKFGINRFYLIRGEKGTIMVDAGLPLNIRRFRRYLKKFSITPEEIKLIILTHGDFDHAGSSAKLKAITGADIAIHEKDRDLLEKAIFNWPPGASRWGKISHAIFYPLMKKMKLTPVKADLVLNNDSLSLEKYGVKGKVLYTPGHTDGSVSVLLDSGDAFVGCLAHNFWLFTLRPKLPIYAKDIDKIKESWKQIIEMGAKRIYPGHGNAFDLEKILKYL